MNNWDMRHFQDDYIISWDLSDKDRPCINVSLLRSDKGARLEMETIGISFAPTGVVSLRQVLEDHREQKRLEEERAERVRERLKNMGGAAEKAGLSMAALADSMEEAKR